MHARNGRAVESRLDAAINALSDAGWLDTCSDAGHEPEVRELVAVAAEVRAALAVEPPPDVAARLRLVVTVAVEQARQEQRILRVP
jgi:hypothetical protein